MGVQLNDYPGPTIFTPDNEPYLGRELLYHFDQLIVSVLEYNGKLAGQERSKPTPPAQQMASQQVSQSISIALSIRELIRQGFLFGAIVLLRPLAERATMLLYLQHFPSEIEKWEAGWQHNKAPSFAKMAEAIQERIYGEKKYKGFEITQGMNAVLHGKPESEKWNWVLLPDGGLGHAPSKVLDRPDMCDEICADVIPWLATVLGMMAAYFGGENVA